MAQDHDRNALVARAIQICQLTSAETLTLAELARRLDVSERTARRFVYALQAAGVDLEPCDVLGAGSGAVRARRAYRLNRQAWLGLLDVPAV